MATIVLKDGTKLNFPDDTPKDVVRKAVQNFQDKQSGADFSGADELGRPPVATPRDPVEDPPTLGDELQEEFKKIGEQAGGILETGVALGSAAAGQVVGGFGSLGPAVTKGSIEAEQTKEAISEGLRVDPVTEAGKETLEAISPALEVVGKAAENTAKLFGDTVFEETGSPALAAAAATWPDFISTIIGTKGARSFVKKRAAPSVKKGEVREALNQSAPTTDKLRNTANAIYKEIDDIGATVKPGFYNQLVDKIEAGAIKRGIEPDITPKATKFLAKIKARRGDTLKLSELTDIRRKAQALADSGKPNERAIGISIINEIDDFLGNESLKSLNFPEGSAKDVGLRLRTARKTWGRAKKGEEIADIFEKASNADNYEKALKNGFRSLINNKKKMKFFNKADKKFMKRVVNSDPSLVIATELGKLGLQHNLIGGPAAGFFIGQLSTPGIGAAVPLAGTIGEFFAKRWRRGNAKYADSIIRAGTDGEKIVKRYLKHTPKAQRSAEELSELLSHPNTKLDILDTRSELVREAVRLAPKKKAAFIKATGAAAAAAASPADSGPREKLTREEETELAKKLGF